LTPVNARQASFSHAHLSPDLSPVFGEGMLGSKAATILVVNDHTAARDALVELLREEDFAVTAYASAPQCLAECDFRHVACAVVSHDMDDMTGFELAKIFQSGWLAIPTILLAETLPGALTDRTEAGVIAVLGIPPEPNALYALLRAAVKPPSQATS
jgi:FixJ family two-component response regulator